MSLVEVVEGAARDGVRTLLLAMLRRRGDVTGRLLDPAMYADPYPTYRWVREQGTPVGTEFGLALAGHDVCDAVLRSPHVISASGRRKELLGQGPRFQRWLFSLPDRGDIIEPIGPESMIGLDGAAHARLRGLVKERFTPAAIERWRPRVEQIADELLDQVQGPSFDVMNGFADELPVRVICELLGVPAQERAEFQRWGAAIATDLDALTPAHTRRAATRALHELTAYLTDLLRRCRGRPGDDLISDLLHQQDEQSLSPRELTGLCTLLLFAGFETTVNLIGNGVMALVEHPDQGDLLAADAALIPQAVEEMLRYDAPVQMVARIPQRTLEVEGMVLPEGLVVSLFLGGANRDPAVFDDPDRLDVRRSNARRHLAFAAGPHHCLGAALARLEGEVAFARLLDRFGPPRLAGRALRRRSFVIRGYRRIPLATR